jgi:protein-arginine deiminase
MRSRFNVSPRPPLLARAPYVAVFFAACSDEPLRSTGARAPTADLRADSNRDGLVTFEDDSDADKRRWDATRGAIVLANIDDDAERCSIARKDADTARCNDADDDVINGAEDALDLARLRTRPGPQPSDATGRVFVLTDAAKDKVRLFHRTGPSETDFTVLPEGATISRAEIEQGVELAIEAKDIVRDRQSWDGYVDLEFVVSSPSRGVARDSVRMRVAPVLSTHHLMPAEQVWLSKSSTRAYAAMHEGVARSCERAGLPAPTRLDVTDPWAQDFFETGFMSMPAEGGRQHVIRVNYRSPNLVSPPDKDAPLRPAGRVVFALRGRDTAGVQHYDPSHAVRMDRLSSFGNFETVPPYEKDGESFPFGRVLRGSIDSYYPDRAFTNMVDAQGIQPAIHLDTSWLYVSHVDETLSFVKAPTARGWAVLAADTRLGKELLERAASQGHGDVKLFVGKKWLDHDTGNEDSAEISIRSVLDDTQVMQASAEGTVEVDAQLEVLKRETGLSNDEILRVPALDTIYGGRSVAYVPAMVNGLYLAPDRFAAPLPHGPVVDGEDLFAAAFEKTLAAIGIKVDWVEDWDGFHRNFGQVHCGSNATRNIPDARWWESGR